MVLVAGVPLVIALLAAHAANAGANLPGDRGYELVSPPSKGGADVIAQSYKTFAAEDGDGVAFPATGAFGDVRGTSTDVQYLSRRDGAAGTSGWRTHAITPVGGAPTLLALANTNVPTFEAAFTADLSQGVYKSWRPLTDAPNVAGVSNLYRLRDLDASESHAELLTAGASPLVPRSQTSKLLRQNVFDGASSDLSHVIFQSPWNLAGDGSFFVDGDLYEYADGAGVRRVGRVPSDPDGVCDDVAGPPCVDAASAQAGVSASTLFGGSQHSAGMISTDGSRIVFQVPAGDVAGEIYMREDGVRTFHLNVAEAAGSAQVWEVSRDGARVFFTTGSDLFMYDRTAPEGSRLTRLSANATGDTCFAEGVVAASSDGHYVYFLCGGQLVAGEPFAGVGLFLWHDGALAYIGGFDDINAATLNTPRTAWQFVTASRTSRVTPDGRFLLFMSLSDEGFSGRGGFAGYDHGTTCSYGGFSACRELYLYSADTGRLVCVSCNPRSSVATGDALTDVHVEVGVSLPTQHLSHALSDDGRQVFFSTSEALVPEDLNGKWDAYEYDVPSGALHLISSGNDPADSYFLDASPDGHDVFFVTREQLVGWDVDENYDLYDARVDGGFPEPAPSAQPCSGETCRGPVVSAPSAAASASAQVRGAGDAVVKLKKHRRCKRGTVLRRVRGKRRCVHRRTHRHHSRHGRAQANRSGR